MSSSTKGSPHPAGGGETISNNPTSGLEVLPDLSSDMTAQEIYRAIQESVRTLIKLAKEQGYVTVDDINECLPGGLANPDYAFSVASQLSAIEIEIIGASDVDNIKEAHKWIR